MVKQLPNWLKIGFQARFGPNFTVEMEAEIPKKFGLAYCTSSVVIIAGILMLENEEVNHITEVVRSMGIYLPDMTYEFTGGCK